MANEVHIDTACEQIFGMTARQYRTHVKEKGAPAVVKGQVDVLQASKYLINYYKVLAKGQGSLALTEERTRLVKEQADQAEKERMLFDKTLVLKKDVDNEAFKIGREVRDVFMVMPDRVDALIAAETSQRRVNKILMDEIRANLVGLGLFVEKIIKKKKKTKRKKKSA